MDDSRPKRLEFSALHRYFRNYGMQPQPSWYLIPSTPVLLVLIEYLLTTLRMKISFNLVLICTHTELNLIDYLYLVFQIWGSRKYLIIIKVMVKRCVTWKWKVTSFHRTHECSRLLTILSRLGIFPRSAWFNPSSWAKAIDDSIGVE